MKLAMELDDARSQPMTDAERRKRDADVGATRPIFVLGMHRSGTSATAALLTAMGAFPGDEHELLPAHAQDNPQGYWEREDVVAANDRLLAASGHSWQRTGGFEARDVPVAAQRQFERWAYTLAERLEAHGTPWLIKDPRLCLLLPLWLESIRDAACVVVVRDPRDIAASLSNTPRGTLTSQFPLVLWEKYMRCLLLGLDGRRALFVSYEALLKEPLAQGARLRQGLASLGVSGMQPEDSAQGALIADLRRNHPVAHVELSTRQSALYDWLSSQTCSAGTVTVSGFPRDPAPDRLLKEFEAAFEYHVERGRNEGRAETKAQLDRIESSLLVQAHGHSQERATLQAQLQAQQERTLLLTEQVAAIEAQRDHHEQALRLSEQALRLSGEQLDVARREMHAMCVHADAIGQRERALRASWSWKITAPLRGIAGFFSSRAGVKAELGLYRLFYSIPGLGPARKRAMILWLHQHAPWLTRHTLSYKFYMQAQELIAARSAEGEPHKRPKRMDAERAGKLIEAMQDPPLISIVMPVYNVERRWLEAAVESVRRQYYPHWELCIADDCSTNQETLAVLAELQQQGDTRIKVQRLPGNVGIAAATNAALEMAGGSHVGLLDNDDELTRDALLEVAQVVLADNPDLIYSDEDKLDENGFNVEPHFKPDFNEGYFFSVNYLCHFAVIRRDLLQRIGGFRQGFDGAQDYELLLRASEQSNRIAHIPKVLYHWRRILGSTAASSAAKPHASAAGQRALAESLARRRIEAQVLPGPFPNSFHVRRKLLDEPLVSILIPFRDKPELLAPCVDSILRLSSYRNFEILGIDNESADAATKDLMRSLAQRDARVRFVAYNEPFNYSAINNFGARLARGEHLLFLNNDTAVIAADWIEAMLEHSQRPEIGAVGAKLLYADETIQHAGVVLGLGGLAGHAHLSLPADSPGYFGRAQLVQEVSAVTFACAMTRRKVFEQVNGLNETALRVAFNDIDYCLRVCEAGYRIVYTSNAVLHHYESKSRGFEDTLEKQQRFANEVLYMQARHADVLRRGDPHYNPNLSLTNNYQVDAGYIDALPI